jgi:hypothetical protein
MALLELREIAKIYRSGDQDFMALHDLDLDIERGEFGEVDLDEHPRLSRLAEPRHLSHRWA